MRRAFGLSVVFAALLATAAFGAQFGRLYVEIPDGWTATQDGPTVGIVKDDNSASVSVTVDGMDGTSLEELAAAFAKQFNATEPELLDGDYTFEFTNGNGVKCEGLLSGDGTDYLLIVVAGADNAAEELGAMVGSIALK